MRMNPAVFGPKSKSANERDATSNAFVSPGQTAREKFGLSHKTSDFSKGFDLSIVDRVETVGTDFSLILPSSLSPVTTSGQVASQVLDHSVSSFFKQEAFRKTALGRDRRHRRGANESRSGAGRKRTRINPTQYQISNEGHANKSEYGISRANKCRS